MPDALALANALRSFAYKVELLQRDRDEIAGMRADPSHSWAMADELTREERREEAEQIAAKKAYAEMWRNQVLTDLTDVQSAMFAPSGTVDGVPGSDWEFRVRCEVLELVDLVGARRSTLVFQPLPPADASRFRDLLQAMKRRGYEAEAMAWGAGTSAAVVGRGDISQTLNDSERNIVEALRKKGTRMTGEEVAKEALGKSCDGYVKGVLSSMTKREIITNRSDVNPRGYGLPEWS